MKKTLTFIAFCIAFCFTSLSQTPRLEIHHIGAGDGDATLIIAIDTVNKTDLFGNKYLDTSIILIDGQRSGGGKEVWRYVQDTINALSPTLKRIDKIILTHLHYDHYGGLPRLISSAKRAGWKIGEVCDRQFANYSNLKPDIVDTCYDSLKVSDPNTSSFRKYQDTLKKYNLSPTTPLQVGTDLFSSFTDIYMFCVVANGVCASGTNSAQDTCFLPYNEGDFGKKIYYPQSENDLSYGFLLRFQGFNYLTTGDLGGVSGSNYTDGETPMTKGIMSGLKYPDGYHICANKVSHHGSEESTTQWFATTNNFTLSVFPACLRSYGSSSHALPTEPVINTLTTAGSELFYTFVPKSPITNSSYWTKGNLDLYNDVIVKLNGLPGYGNVDMQVRQAQKSKKYVYNGVTSVRTVTCTKNHHW